MLKNPVVIPNKNPQQTENRKELPQYNRGHLQKLYSNPHKYGKREPFHFEIREKNKNVSSHHFYSIFF